MGTRTASYILATYRRPKIVQHCVGALLKSMVPAGWRLEVVVCHPKDEEHDFGPDVVRTSAELTDVGSQLTRALEVSTGELVLVTGDDDLQSPSRLGAAIWAYQEGVPISGFGDLIWVRTTDGACVRWHGPPHRAGATLSFARHHLVSAGGWGPVSKNGDAHLFQRLAKVGVTGDMVAHLPRHVADTSIFLSHGGNLHGDRPFPAHGAFQHGSFWVSAAGRWPKATIFAATPQHIRRSLEELCG